MMDALRTIQEGVRSEERTVAEMQKLSRMAANENEVGTQHTEYSGGYERYREFSQIYIGGQSALSLY